MQMKIMMIKRMHLCILRFLRASQLMVRKARKAPMIPSRQGTHELVTVSRMRDEKRYPPIPEIIQIYIIFNCPNTLSIMVPKMNIKRELMKT